MPAGRPTIYTQEIADKLCSLLADGQSMRKACESDGMPCKATIFMWLRTNEEFLDQYTQAKEEAAESYADDINDIANEIGSPVFDEEGNLVYVDGKPLMQVDMVAINHAKLKIDTLKWSASKLKPKRYGDKLHNEHTGPGGGPIQTQQITFAPVGND